MPAPTPAQLLTSQWTRLSTALTQFKDTAGFNPPSQTIGPNAVPNTVAGVPRLGGWDQDLRGLLAAADQDPIPPEVHAVIQLFSQGIAESFFNNRSICTGAAPPLQTSNLAFLDSNFAAVLLYHYLGLFLRRGLPRGPRTDPNSANVLGGFPGPGA